MVWAFWAMGTALDDSAFQPSNVEMHALFLPRKARAPLMQYYNDATRWVRACVFSGLLMSAFAEVLLVWRDVSAYN